MGTFDSVYINKLNKLQEENNKLKTALRMIVEAAGDDDIPPIGLAPYEQDFDDAFPNSPNPSNISPRPAQSSPRGIPFWKWVRQLGNPINFQQWQQWVNQWQQANPGVPWNPAKPGRYPDFLDAEEMERQRLRDEEMWRNVKPGRKPPPLQPLGKPGWGGRLWKAIKPLVTQGPSQNNPAQTTASSVPNGNSQPEVM